MSGQSRLKPWAQYAIAIGLVVAGVLVRMALHPIFPAGAFVFAIFYLVVVLAAYFTGAWPAIAAGILSAVVAYWAFAAPVMAWKVNDGALVSMSFFALTSSVDIYFITGMKRAVWRYRLERTRAEILAQGHAALFHDFNERAANHLHLLGAMLKQDATGKLPQGTNLIAEASRRTMLISSVHRSLSEDSAHTIDFIAFAQELLGSIVRAAGATFIIIEVEGGDAPVPADRATSMAVALFEWSRMVIPGMLQARCPRLAVTLATVGDEHRMTFTAHGWAAEGRTFAPAALSEQIVEAMADHLRGRQRTWTDAGKLNFELSYPLLPGGQTHADAVPTSLWQSAPTTLQ